jgi:hypothetical protein
MKCSMSGVLVLIAGVWPVAAGAQSGGTMATADNMAKMQMMVTSYTGCIEAGSVGDAFTLTHLKQADRPSKQSMKMDSMPKDTMAKDTMNHDSMAPAALILSGSPVDLRKHLGHKVTVSGSLAHEKKDAMEQGTMDKAAPMFTVTSLKMVATTCP